ncbi:DUF648 domain-containing protein [Candidatus Chlamydia corallus]|uniref:DUF648 domain-containing protein n=1 Tax=Candidatus Chlamydia corallus TaxID=2038470 RepID=UPI000C2FD917|nr:DUF648 domain-containing protein [Candidatus Chlamydia corallus]
MSNIRGYADYSSSTFGVSLMRRLDSYLFGTTKIVSYDPEGFILIKEVKLLTSMAAKILRILAFILFPVILIAFVINYFLHKKYDIKVDRKCLYLPIEMTKEEELILAANPKLVSSAALAASPLFYGFPRKYQVVKIEAPEGQLPKITFSINIELLLEDLNVESVNWPTLHLYEDLDFTGHPQERALIEKIRGIEGRDSKQMSLLSKRLLTRHFLECFCNTLHLEKNSVPLLLYTYDHNTYGIEKTIWHEIYFAMQGLQKYSPGACLSDRILELGFSLGRIFALKGSCSGALWVNRYGIEFNSENKQEILGELGFFPLN